MCRHVLVPCLRWLRVGWRTTVHERSTPVVDDPDLLVGVEAFELDETTIAAATTRATTMVASGRPNG